jgi:hypothetical protein
MIADAISRHILKISQKCKISAGAVIERFFH